MTDRPLDLFVWLIPAATACVGLNISQHLGGTWAVVIAGAVGASAVPIIPALLVAIFTCRGTKSPISASVPPTLTMAFIAGLMTLGGRDAADKSATSDVATLLLFAGTMILYAAATISLVWGYAKIRAGYFKDLPPP